MVLKISILALFFLVLLWALALLYNLRFMDFHKTWAVRWKTTEIRERSKNKATKILFRRIGHEPSFDMESILNKTKVKEEVEEYKQCGERVEKLTLGAFQPIDEEILQLGDYDDDLRVPKK